MKKRLLAFPALAFVLAICLGSGAAYGAGEVTVQKLISVDGGVTWEDANVEPGPIITEGTTVDYQYIVQNNTDVPLEYIVTDSDFVEPVGLGTLEPLSTTILYASSIAVLDQHSNIVAVIANTSDGTTYFTEDIANYYGIIPSQPITIDIKPGGDTNSINLKSNGVVPVALISSAEFDATSLFDGDTVLMFEGAEALRWSVEDVNNDGIDDIILHFRTHELDLTADSTMGDLTIGDTYDPLGNLITSYDGQDTVNIVPNGKSDNNGVANTHRNNNRVKSNNGNKGGNSSSNKNKNKD